MTPNPALALRKLASSLALVALALSSAASAAPDAGPAPATAPETIRLLSYNIRHARGMDGQLDLARTAAVIEGLTPDIVALQEVDNTCQRSGQVDQAAALAEKLTMHLAFAKFMDFQGGEYGLAILSRFPILKSHTHQLPEGGEPRVALEIVVEAGLPAPLSITCLHFDWQRDDTARLSQAKALLKALADRADQPAILIGDFNDQPGSPTLQLVEADGWQELPKDEEGGSFTFPSDAPSVEIDYIYARGIPSAKHASSLVIAEPIASDHRPVLGILPLDK
jgi:endonuclease/exonuclease/phosphatase family metal-dependent hydrolase